MVPFFGLDYNMADSEVGPAVQATTSVAGAISCRPTVVDGDTLRFGGTRIRLQGIYAPEMPGHCRPGRVCAPGDPYASSDNLRQPVSGGGMSCHQTDTDRYGRVVALCDVGGVHRSGEQVRSGHAIRRYAPPRCSSYGSSPRPRRHPARGGALFITK